MKTTFNSPFALSRWITLCLSICLAATSAMATTPQTAIASFPGGGGFGSIELLSEASEPFLTTFDSTPPFFFVTLINSTGHTLTQADLTVGRIVNDVFEPSAGEVSFLGAVDVAGFINTASFSSLSSNQTTAHVDFEQAYALSGLPFDETQPFGINPHGGSVTLSFGLLAGLPNPAGGPDVSALPLGIHWAFTSVPEPSSLGLLIAGGLALLRRRSRCIQ